MIKTADTQIVDEVSTKYSEEQLQNIKDWIDHSLTGNLADNLREKIETEKKNWMYGAYVPAENKSLGDYNAGYIKGLYYTLEFIERGGIDGIAESDK